MVFVLSSAPDRATAGWFDGAAAEAARGHAQPDLGGGGTCPAVFGAAVRRSGGVPPGCPRGPGGAGQGAADVLSAAAAGGGAHRHQASAAAC